MSKRTFQLSVRDVPTAFDYYFDNDLLVVASRSDLAFYHLHDLGSPHRVIFYDQPLKCNLVKLQYGTQNLAACVNEGGYVSIWDPSQSVRPMLDFIHPSKQISDLRWSPISQESLATCSIAGNLTLWDIRTTLRPTHDMMVGKSCEHIEWCPHNPYLMSASCESKYLLVWDVRMMPSLIDDGFNGLEESDEQQVHVIESEHGILNYAWNAATPSVYIATQDGGMDAWALSPVGEGVYESTRSSSSRSTLINENTTLVPGPYGERLALLYHKPNSRESSVYIKRFADASCGISPTKYGTAPLIESPQDKSSSVVDPFVKIGTSKSPILDLKWANPPLGSASDSPGCGLDLLMLNEDGLLQVVKLPGSGRARSAFDRGQGFRPKRMASTFASLAPHGSGFSSVNEMSQIDLKTRPLGLRGMKQSLGPSQSGLTDRADGTPASVPAPLDTRDRAGTYTGTGTSNSNTNLLEKREATPTTPSGPGTLKRNSFGSKSFFGTLPAPTATSSANIASTAAYASNPHLIMVGPVRFYSLLEDDINALEYGINHGYLEGWRIGRIDQFSRRIVLELLIPNIDSYTITNTQQNASFSTYYRSEDLHSFYHKKGNSSVRVMELALLFPVKFVNFWCPTFSIEDKTGLGFNPAALSSVIIELTAICKGFAEKANTRASTTELSALGTSKRAGVESASINDCLLFQISRCFRKRLFKIWERIIETDRISISYTTIQQGANDNNVLSTSLQSDHEMEVDEHAPYMKYIEDEAFRVPASVMSAGIFNARGQLVCFGNAKMCLSDSLCEPTPPQLMRTCSVSATGKHKSYANTLVSKIINTSAGTEVGEPGSLMHGSQSLEFESILSALSPSVDASQASTVVAETRPAPAVVPPIVTFDTSHRALPKSADSSSAHSHRDRTSSDYSETLSRGDDATEDTDGEEDYQFTFDQETKEPQESPRGAAANSHRDSHLASDSLHLSSADDSMQSEVVFDYAQAGGNSSGVFPKNNMHSASMQSITEDGHDMAKKSANKHPLQVYSVAYATEVELLHAYSVGPLTRRTDGTAATPITPVAQAVAREVAHNSSGRGRARSRSNPTPAVSSPRLGFKIVHPLTQEEAHDRASACRYNAQVVQQIAPDDRGLSQFWNLLAVVLDMLTITDSGCLIDWNHCTIGLALLHRLYKYLREINDLQTFATAICIMGGSDILVDLLYPYYQNQASVEAANEEKKSASASVFEPYRIKRELESVLYVYNDVLNRWGEQLSAVEVSKHINFDHFSLQSQKEFLDAKGCEFSVKVCCYYCEKEIQPQRQDASGFSSRSTSTSSLNTPNLSAKIATFSGASSTTAAQVTFYPGTQFASTVPAVNATTSRSSKLLWCQDCKDWAQRCVVCELAVRGTVSVCAKCGHGGHFSHMQTWFARSKVCASGCGCRCTEDGPEKVSEDSSDDEDELEEFAEDGENVHDMYDNIFGANPPDYLEEIYNKSSDYNYNNFYDKWNDSQSQGVYYEFSS